MARIIATHELTEDNPLSKNDTDWVYNGLDCCLTHEIWQKLDAQLDPVARNTYNFSLALRAPIMEMNLRGILIDTTRRTEVLKSFEDKTAQVSRNLNRVIEDGIGLDAFNYRSPAQVKTLLYDVLNLPKSYKRGANGARVPTVNRDTLEKLQHYYWGEFIAGHLLFLRDLDKKCQFLRSEIDADNRTRTSYNIAGTVTGRLASSISDFGTGGNQQNIDRELRTVCIADKGYKFANIDLEQGDSRNVGAICWQLFRESHGEEFAGAYLDACESGDLHTTVSRMVWPTIGFTPDMSLREAKAIAEQIFYRQDSYRQTAKKLGHGTNYLGTPRTMAGHSKMDVPTIDKFQIKYFTAFPCIQEWHKVRINQIITTRQLTTMLGRRRFFWGRPNDPKTHRDGIAYEPQSMTADEIDTAMLNIWRSGRVQMMAQVHDSLLVQYREEEEDEIIPWLLQAARTVIPLSHGRDFCVPVDCKVGWNWGDWDSSKPLDNPDGLMKWKGSDSRKRQSFPSNVKPSIWRL